MHGSPGIVLLIFSRFGFVEKALLVTTDRPGFGYSHFGIAETSLEKQNAALKTDPENIKTKAGNFLVGHSLGGPVIAQMAMDYPELVGGLVFVDFNRSVTGAGQLGSTLVGYHLPGLRCFPAPFAFEEEIYRSNPSWRTMPAGKTLNAGDFWFCKMKDQPVDPGNAAVAKRGDDRYHCELATKDDMNHFVPWSDRN